MFPPASGHSSPKPHVPPKLVHGRHGYWALGQGRPLLSSSGLSIPTGHEHPSGQPRRLRLSSACSPSLPPCCAGCSAFPAHLKHFFVQNPGAKHNDAIDVYNGVVTAVQEFRGLLFTVQDQGDIFLVDAECNSVPPAKKRTTRRVTGSSVASAGNSAANCWESRKKRPPAPASWAELSAAGLCRQDTCGHRCQPHRGHREAHPTSGSLRFLVSQTRSAV